jgi:hypothetical protein
MIKKFALNPFGEDAGFVLDEWEEDYFGRVVGHLHRRIVDTREAMVRSALIGLGWTPPGTNAHATEGDLRRRLHEAEVTIAELRLRLADALVAA